MKIPLDLTHHCIETAIKRCHNAAISRYFKDIERKSALETEIALLVQALETFDFNRLRSQWPVLCGHNGARVSLTAGTGDHPGLLVDGTPLGVPTIGADSRDQVAGGRTPGFGRKHS